MTPKKMWLKFWYIGYYNMAKLRGYTTETGNDKNRYSYDEFLEHTGITVTYYDANVDVFKDMNRDAVQEWIKENPDWNKTE